MESSTNWTGRGTAVAVAPISICATAKGGIVAAS